MTPTGSHCIDTHPHPANPTWVWVDILRRGASRHTVASGTGHSLREAVADAIASLDRDVIADVIAELIEDAGVTT